MGRRILLVSEAVSIAHVARPTVLGDALAPRPDEGADEIHFASSGAFSFCHAGRPWQFHALHSVAAPDFLRRLAATGPLYSLAELQQYLAADLALLQALKPDVVVHDFRLTMPLAGRIAGVPVLSLCNAHWSPFARLRPSMAPDLPVMRLLGAPLVDAGFRAVWPLVNRIHVRAINRLRRQHGQAAVGSLSEYYCSGDHVLYADVPELVPLRSAPPNHVYIGPVVWSPALPRPPWWDEVTRARGPKAYVTLGSTGRADLMPQIAAACQRHGIAALIATAGRQGLPARQVGIHAADFLPGSDAAAAADFVVCNGGSATAHQALAQGRPVLGICSNLDQVLTMQTIVEAGAGLMLRASQVNARRLDACLARMRDDPALRAAARRLAAAFAAHDVPGRFHAALQQTCPV